MLQAYFSKLRVLVDRKRSIVVLLPVYHHRTVEVLYCGVCMMKPKGHVLVLPSPGFDTAW